METMTASGSEEGARARSGLASSWVTMGAAWMKKGFAAVGGEAVLDEVEEAGEVLAGIVQMDPGTGTT